MTSNPCQANVSNNKKESSCCIASCFGDFSKVQRHRKYRTFLGLRKPSAHKALPIFNLRSLCLETVELSDFTSLAIECQRQKLRRFSPLRASESHTDSASEEHLSKQAVIEHGAKYKTPFIDDFSTLKKNCILRLVPRPKGLGTTSNNNTLF